MIPVDQMPEDNADLAKIVVDFPRLPLDGVGSCPVPLAQVLDYLGREGEAIAAGQLHFLRTAQVADRAYWIWEFAHDTGSKCYATVSTTPGSGPTVGYEEDYYGLTPEQFILGDFHHVF